MDKYHVNVLKEYDSTLRHTLEVLFRMGDDYYLHVVHKGLPASEETLKITSVSDSNCVEELVKCLLKMGCSPKEVGKILKDDEEMRNPISQGSSTSINAESSEEGENIICRSKPDADGIYCDVVKIGDSYFHRTFYPDGQVKTYRETTVTSLRQDMLAMGVDPKVVEQLTLNASDLLY